MAYRKFLTGIAELLIFHPVDTVAKRLMSNKAKVCERFLVIVGIDSHALDV
jgi:hypothetical protein